MAGKTIEIYKTFGLKGAELLGILKGHSLRVNSLSFNNLRMLSTSLDGAVYEWDLTKIDKNNCKIKESVIKVLFNIY